MIDAPTYRIRCRASNERGMSPVKQKGGVSALQGTPPVLLTVLFDLW